MPVTITPVRALTTIQCPLDGESGDASDLATTTIQPIANQLKNAHDRIRWGGSAAMTVQTDVEAGDIWINDAYGTYVAQSSSFGLGAFWEVESTGTSGIWWRNTAFYETLQADRGLVRYGPITGYDDATPNGKIPTAHLTNRFYSSQRIYGAARLNETISASELLVVTSHIGVHDPAVVGDYIDGCIGPIRLINMASSPANAYAYLRIRAIDAYGSPGESNNQIGEVILDPTQDITVTIPFRHVVQTGTATRIVLLMNSSSSNGMQAIGCDVTGFSVGTMMIHRP